MMGNVDQNDQAMQKGPSSQLHNITAWIDIFKGSRLLWIVNNSVSMCEQ